MQPIMNRRVQLMAILTIAILSLLLINQTALADDKVIQGDSIEGDDVVDNDVFMNGRDVDLFGTVNGDAVIIGRSVAISGDVEGSVVVIGGDVAVNGDVKGSVYSLAVSFHLLEGGKIGRNLYFLGLNMVTQEGSNIERDLHARTMSSVMAGDIGRHNRVFSGPIGLVQMIIDLLNEISIGDPVPDITTSESGRQKIAQLADNKLLAGTLGPIMTAELKRDTAAAVQDEADAEEEGENLAVEFLVNFFRDLITFLVIGGVIIWLIPKWLEKWASSLRKKTLASGGWGMVAAITGYVGLTIIFALILVIGMSFIFVTLWGLSFTVLSVGLSALGLVSALFQLAVSYVSKIIVAYALGQIILERFGASPNMRKPWPLLLGLVIYVLLSSIPFLGWAISIIVTFLGLGAIWLAFQNRSNKSEEG